MQAVITGDIINSTLLKNDDRKHLEKHLRSNLLSIAGSGENYEINRGDSFQVIASEPTNAFLKCVELRARLKYLFKANIDARLAIGLGEITMRGETIGSSDGEAFQLSGRKFDSLLPNDLALGISTGKELNDKGLDVISGFCDHLIRSWSKYQCEAIAIRINGFTYDQIAEKTGVSKSAVFKRVSSANFRQIEKVNEYYKFLIKELSA